MNFILFSRSFFQSICVLGYCVLPLAVAAIVVKITALVGLKKGLVAIIVDFIIVALAFVWSMFGRFFRNIGFTSVVSPSFC